MGLKRYYRLTKPGIIYGNALTTLAGYLYASRWHIELRTLLGVLLGTCLVIAAGCVINNYLDRSIDAKMQRTSKRALVTGDISVTNALIFAACMLVLGFAILLLETNALTVCVGLIGLVDYVVLYGIAKRRGTYGTLVGSISGATPILAGYIAVTGHMDTNAWLLFALLICWQMPHFYAIAMYRKRDYVAAGIPVLSTKHQPNVIRTRMLLYIVLFGAVSMLLTITGSASYICLTTLLTLTVAWLAVGFSKYGTLNAEEWARSMFFVSLMVILGLSAAVAVGTVLD